MSEVNFLLFHAPFHMLDFVTACVHSTREGTVFIGVCLFTSGEGGGTYLPRQRGGTCLPRSGQGWGVPTFPGRGYLPWWGVPTLVAGYLPWWEVPTLVGGTYQGQVPPSPQGRYHPAWGRYPLGQVTPPTQGRYPTAQGRYPHLWQVPPSPT